MGSSIGTAASGSSVPTPAATCRSSSAGSTPRTARSSLPAQTIQELPSSYLDRIRVDSIVYTPEALKLTVDVFGPDNVFYGSDFPHKNGKMEEILGLVGGLGRSERDRIVGGNAEGLFRL